MSGTQDRVAYTECVLPFLVVLAAPCEDSRTTDGQTDI